MNFPNKKNHSLKFQNSIRIFDSLRHIMKIQADLINIINNKMENSRIIWKKIKE